MEPVTQLWYLSCRLMCSNQVCNVAGNSTFFFVRRIEDPIALLPNKLILGINKRCACMQNAHTASALKAPVTMTYICMQCLCHRGVHFFRPVPKEYLHSAELRDIMQFGSSSSAVFFKMRVAGVLHVFQFDTRQVHSQVQCLSGHWHWYILCCVPSRAFWSTSASLLTSIYPVDAGRGHLHGAADAHQRHHDEAADQGEGRDGDYWQRRCSGVAGRLGTCRRWRLWPAL
jgi:hypothetical protein